MSTAAPLQVWSWRERGGGRGVGAPIGGSTTPLAAFFAAARGRGEEDGSHLRACGRDERDVLDRATEFHWPWEEKRM